MIKYILLLGCALIGITSVKFFSYPVTDYLLITATVFFFLDSFICHPKKLIVNKYFSLHFVFVSLFFLGALLSTPQSSDILKSLINSFRFVWVFLLLPIVFYSVISTRERLRYFFVALSFVPIIIGLSAVTQYVGWTGLSYIEESRLTGITNHPNELGGLSSICFVFSLYLVRNEGTWFGLRGLGLVACIFSVVGVFLSSSYSAAVVLLSTIILSLWLSGSLSNWKTHIYFICGALLLVLGLQTLVNVNPKSYHLYSKRINSESISERSVGTRVSTYALAINEIIENPVVGKGLAFEDRKPGAYQIHNMFLLSWSCAGIFGLIGSIGILMVPFLQFFRLRRITVLEGDKEFISFSFAAVFGMCLFVMVSPNLYVLTTFFPLLIWNGVNSVILNEKLAIAISLESK